MSVCACGAPATANGRECGACFHERLASVVLKVPPAGRPYGRAFDARLQRFRDTAAEGSVPRAVTDAAIVEARRTSDETGRPFSTEREAP